MADASVKPSYGSIDAASAGAVRRILDKLFSDYDGPVSVRLWNGEELNPNLSAPAVLVIHHPAALRDFILCADLVRLAEALRADGAGRIAFVCFKRH